MDRIATIRIFAWLAAVPAIIAWSLPAAESLPALQEVIVTATLRARPLDEVPGSVTVIGRRQLLAGGGEHLEDWLPAVPALSWAGASSRPRYFQLRGIGELEQYQGAPNPSVGFLVDDIDLSGIGMVASLFDVEQVEVLRGPQGTRYGANALAGLILVRTRAPTPEPVLRIEGGAGSDGLRSAGLVAGGPLAVGAWRVAVRQAVGEGFRDNVALGRDDTNARDELTMRARLRLGPGGPWRADLTLLHLDFDNGYDAFAIDNSLRTRSDRPGRDAQRTDGVSLDAIWDAGGSLTWRSTSAAADSSIVTSFDGDWGNDADWGAAGPYDFFSTSQRQRRTLSQDLRVASADGQAPGWLAGVYLLQLQEDNQLEEQGRYLVDQFQRRLGSRYRATSIALYGQAEWTLGERTVLGAGLRGERRAASYADSDGAGFQPADRMWGGEVSLNHRTRGGAMAWASLSRGYKAGGFNPGPAVPAGRQEFGPEHLWNAELGWRNQGADGRVDGELSLFYMRRGQQQVATSFQQDPQDPLTFIYLTDNAARGEAWGLESALRWRASGSLELESTLSLMQSRFIDYRNGGRDLRGRAWAHAPGWKSAMAATWRNPGGWMTRLELSGEDGFFHDIGHDQRAPARFLVNLRAGYGSGQWSVHAWVRNLLDRRYPVRGFYFGNEPPDFPEKLYVRLGDPRQAGVTATIDF